MQRKLIILGQVNFSIFAALIGENFIRQIKFCAGKMKIFGCKIHRLILPIVIGTIGTVVPGSSPG